MLKRQRSLKTTFAKMEMKVSVPFSTQRHFKVTRMMSVEEGANLVASFTTSEVRNLRVSVNSFFEHLVLVTEIIRQFG